MAKKKSSKKTQKKQNKKTNKQLQQEVEDLIHKYDKILKELLNNRILIKQLIKGFINEEWVKNIDFRTLKKEKTDFLTENLQEFRKDLLWSVRLKGQRIYFYIHIEFQSIPDRKMPFRFLIYDSLLHIDILENRKGNEKSKKLPFILPILFYIGDSNWNFEFDLTKLIEQPFNNAIDYIPKFEIFKIMLNEKSLEDLKEIDNLLSYVLATDNKEINKKALNKIIKKIKNILSEYNEEKKIMLIDKINKFFKLLSNDKIDMTEAIRELNKEDTMGGLMNLINKEREEGIKEGIKEGIEKGMEKGKYEKAIETAIEMLKDSVEPVFVQKYTKLPIEKIKELKKEL